MLLYRRLRHSFDNYGFRGMILRVFGGAADIPPEIFHPFDLTHTTDTSGYFPGAQLASGSPADLYTTAYYAISPSTFTAALRRFPQACEPFTFVDLGCGKGRALLLAAELPFAAILGVDLSPDLCRVAARNTHSDPRITIQQHDATTVQFPETPLLVYLYHPFLAPALRRTLRNLERQLHALPRPVYLLRANPTYPRLVRSFPFLETVWDYSFPLSPEDAAADRHGIVSERFTLSRARLSEAV